MSQFTTREGQLSALAFLVQKPIFFTQKKPLLDRLRLSKKIDHIISLLKSSFDKYQILPTQSELTEILKTQLIDQAKFIDLDWLEYEEIIHAAYHKEVTPTTGEMINEYLAEIKKQELADLLAQASPGTLNDVCLQVEKGLKELRRTRYHDFDFGIDFFSEAADDVILGAITDYRETSVIRGPWPEFDEYLMAGGTRKGEINAFVGVTNIGKTTILLNLSKGFAENQHRVLHIYLDSMENETATRMQSSISEQNLGFSLEIGHADQLREMRAEMRKKYKPGTLFMKQFPARSIDPETLDEYLENFFVWLASVDADNPHIPKEKKGLIDVVVLDYFELLASVPGAESDFTIDEIKAQMLNAVAIKYNVAIWTASQGGTDAMKTDKPKLHQAHGFKSKFHPFANIFMICCPEEEKVQLLRHFTFEKAKSRRASRASSISMKMYCELQRIVVDKDQPMCYSVSTSKEVAASRDAREIAGVNTEGVLAAVGLGSRKPAPVQHDEETGEIIESEQSSPEPDLVTAGESTDG